jgi:hypothetical protein
MRIGPPKWRCVSLDEAGVPTGFPFGDLEYAQKRLAPYGLFLCWSRHQQAFVLYSKRGAKYISQFTFWEHKSGKIIPVSRRRVDWLCQAYDRFCRTSGKTIKSRLLEAGKAKKEKRSREMREHVTPRIKEAYIEAQKRLGKKTRRITVPMG